MEIQHFLIIAGAGLIAGFINTIAGGGSLLTLPALIFLGLPPSIANGTNRLAILFGTLSATSGFRSKGISVFPYSIWLSISSIIGAIIGAKIAIDIKGELFNRILAVVMVLVVLNMIFRPFGKKGSLEENLSKKKQWYGVIAFFFVGIYGGFIQAGVGFIILAILTSINGLSLVKSNSIKVFVVFIYTFSAFVVFLLESKVNWQLGLTMAAGQTIGAWTASRLSVKSGDKWIRPVLIVTVVALSIKLWFF
ncbi:sulfite exporter TauE/SafE family protein [Fulvivirgaceae bacterium BMA10]|uniref:Probable membrane transporter protein n=1 Tax=Splendidivirga corallicola TaxID=3051826 RepID=A0ABT8KLQ7_9BACT|nr:sulfite exporter TauE/SafE family protein [Fulvivirgaceae bacterium BMA10]